MRSVVMLLVGLIAGAIGGTTAMRTLSAGNEWPHGVMALLKQHHGEVRKVAGPEACDAAAVGRHAATLRQVAMDVEPAFLPTENDPLFRNYAGDLRAAIAALEASLGQGCPAVAEAAAAVGDACKACHRDFKP